jgi:hypothetical protein
MLLRPHGQIQEDENVGFYKMLLGAITSVVHTPHLCLEFDYGVAGITLRICSRMEIHDEKSTITTNK